MTGAVIDTRRSDAVGDGRLSRALGEFSTGFTIVSARAEDGTPWGATADAVSSVSLDPPLVRVRLRRASRTLKVILERGRFALSALEAGQEAMAQQFAHSTQGLAWGGVSYHVGLLTGAPLIGAAPATLEAEVHDTADDGDQVIVIGRVLELRQRDDQVDG